MNPGFTPVPNDLFEAVLRFKCPASQKDVIFAVIRLTEGYHTKERALSVSYLSKFLKSDKSNIARRLICLIEAKVLKETSSPDCIKARHIEINRNYCEWIPAKRKPAKEKTDKKNLPPAPKDKTDARSSINFFPNSPEITRVAISTTPPVVKLTTNKDTSSALSQNKTTAVAVVLKKRSEGKNLQQLNKGKPASKEEELEEILKAIYVNSLGRKPNIDEVYEMRKQVTDDQRFSEADNMTILKNAFHRAAISEEGKRHMVYILGIIRSMKQDKLKQRDKVLKEQETNAAEKQKFTSWEDAGFSLIEEYRRTYHTGG